MKNLKEIKSGIIIGLSALATMIIGGIIYAAVGSSWTSPDSLQVGAGSGLSATSWNQMLANMNNLNDKITSLTSNISTIPQFLGYAEQTTALTVTNQTFTDLPGTTLTFNLASPKKIGMKAFGSTTYGGTNSSGYSSTHCGFRFVVDGTPYGDTTWGDQIIGCGYNSSTSSYGRRCPWNIERNIDLGTGSHTIKVQMKDWQTGYYGCANTINNFSKARLFVETKN